MECTEFQQIVAGEREEDLSPAESLAFEEHLEACESCRESVLRAEDDLERLAALAEPPVLAAAAWARVDEAVRSESRKKPGREDPLLEVALTVTASSADVSPPISIPERKTAAALVPAEPRAALERGRRSRSGLAFACAASLFIAVFLGFFAFPTKPSRSPEASIGRVKSFDPADVELLSVVYGEGYYGIQKTQWIYVCPIGLEVPPELPDGDGK